MLPSTAGHLPTRRHTRAATILASCVALRSLAIHSGRRRCDAGVVRNYRVRRHRRSRHRGLVQPGCRGGGSCLGCGSTFRQVFAAQFIR